MNTSKHPLYASWRRMINRCHNNKVRQYPDYGGRGIKVCKRWHTFNNFLKDMGDRPKDLSLERLDNNKGYSKDNCKWATTEEQANNKRNTRYLRYRGRVVPFTLLCNELGINRDRLRVRLDRYGNTIEEAIDICKNPLYTSNSTGIRHLTWDKARGKWKVTFKSFQKRYLTKQEAVDKIDSLLNKEVSQNE